MCAASFRDQTFPWHELQAMCSLQSPLVAMRRSSTRTVKRNGSLSRMGSLGPISRRGSLVAPDGLPRSPSRGLDGSLSRSDVVPELPTSRPALGPTIREHPSQEGGPMPSEEARSPAHSAGSGAERTPRAGEVEMLPHSRSTPRGQQFYHN